MRWGYFALKRQGLDLNQPYVTEQMGVTASTIQRYEAGTIDNTKKLVLDGLSYDTYTQESISSVPIVRIERRTIMAKGSVRKKRNGTTAFM